MSAGKLVNVTENDVVLYQNGFLGKGSFATCQLCSLKSDESHAKLVLKELQSPTRESVNGINMNWIEKRLMREVQAMHKLGQERDDFVKVLWLYIKDGRFFGYGMELCDNGSLRQFIKRLESTIEPSQVFPFLTAKWMLQVSDGFDYLQTRESGSLLHLDLAVDNILVTEGLDVKIADFGLAKSITDSIATQHSLELEQHRTIERRVPEKYDHLFRQPDAYSDRYLYGICVVEAFSRQSLRSSIGSEVEVYKGRVRDGRHLIDFEHLVDVRCFDVISDKDQQVDQLQSTVKQVISLTAHQEPKKRATFDSISEFWRDCDTLRMEAERIYVLDILQDDDVQNERLASKELPVRATLGDDVRPSVANASEEALSDNAIGLGAASGLKAAPKTVSVQSAQRSHQDYLDECRFQLTNYFDDDFSRYPPDFNDYGDSEYDSRDFLHDY